MTESPNPNPRGDYLVRTNSHLGYMLIGLLWNDPEIRGQTEGTLHFRNKARPTQHVELSAPPQSLSWERIKQILKLDFVGTMGELREWSDDPEEQVAVTPYGEMRGGFFLGADNNLYSFRNYYLFTLDGDGFVYEEVRRHSTGDAPMIKTDNVRQLGFSPNPDDSRARDMSPEEYEKVGHILHQIDNGDFGKI